MYDLQICQIGPIGSGTYIGRKGFSEKRKRKMKFQKQLKGEQQGESDCVRLKRVTSGPGLAHNALI